MDPGISSIFYIKDKSFSIEDVEKLYISPFQNSIVNSEFMGDEVAFKSCCFRCLSVICNFMYYFFVYPYKIVLDKSNARKDNTVKLVASGIRIGIWLIFQLIYLLLAVGSLVKVFKFEKRIADDPTQLYTIAARSIWCGAIILWPYWVISKKKLVCRLLNHSYVFNEESTRLLTKGNLGPVSTVVVYGLMFALSIVNVYDSIEGFLTTGKFSLEFVEIGWDESPDYSVWNSNVAIYFAIALCSLRKLNNWIILTPGLVACIVIFAISKEYLRYINECKGDDERFSKVLETYKVVKKLVKNINKCWSFHVFLIIISMMAEFCNHFTFLIGDSDYTTSGNGWMGRAILVLYFLLLTVCFLLAAEANNKFQKIDQYILANVGSRSNKMETKVEAIILQNDISQNPLGVRAHHFILSYSVLATVLSTVLTYIFIFLQFQSKTVLQ